MLSTFQWALPGTREHRARDTTRIFDPAPIGAHCDDTKFHCGSEVHVHFATPGNMFDRLTSAGVSGHLYGQDEVLLLDGECPDVPNLEETCCVVAGEVRKSHRALGAHRNVHVSQQVRRLKILSALALSRCRAGVKKLLTEHTPSFVSSQNQLQKMFCDGSVMMKPLLCTFRAALCTLTSSTCAEKKRSLPETLNHGSARKP